jgi:hypothetical protein
MGRMPMSNGSGHPGPMDGMPGAMGMGGMPYHSQMHGGGMQPQGGFGPPGLPGGLGFGFSDGEVAPLKMFPIHHQLLRRTAQRCLR